MPQLTRTTVGIVGGGPAGLPGGAEAHQPGAPQSTSTSVAHSREGGLGPGRREELDPP